MNQPSRWGIARLVRVTQPSVYRQRPALKEPFKWLKWLIPLVPVDQHLVGGGLEGEAQAEEPVERGVRGAGCAGG